MNRDNLWNDPYHASDRTWKGYHSNHHESEARAQSLDAVHEYESREEARRQFVMRNRESTRSRFENRRKFNTKLARARTIAPFGRRIHRRQDVCSGMTSTIGGDLRDLPYKALRNIMTPLIETLDTDAANRLKDRLKAEEKSDKELLELRARRRAEILEDLKMRQKSFEALEILSGVTRPRSPPAPIVSQGLSKRTEELAKPRERKPIKPEECLDGLELTHVSNPEVIDALHARV